MSGKEKIYSWNTDYEKCLTLFVLTVLSILYIAYSMFKQQKQSATVYFRDVRFLNLSSIKPDVNLVFLIFYKCLSSPQFSASLSNIYCYSHSIFYFDFTFSQNSCVKKANTGYLVVMANQPDIKVMGKQRKTGIVIHCKNCDLG